LITGGWLTRLLTRKEAVFFEKRTKKLLSSHASSDAHEPVNVWRGPKAQRFFGSFFQKRTASFLLEAFPMKRWPVQDAKARFSELLETCLTDGPQMVTRRGEETAVLVPADEWRRLRQVGGRSLKELLLADEPRADLDIPLRTRWKERPPVEFD
jgi:antitoxin Phd